MQRSDWAKLAKEEKEAALANAFLCPEIAEENSLEIKPGMLFYVEKAPLRVRGVLGAKTRGHPVRKISQPLRAPESKDQESTSCTRTLAQQGVWPSWSAIRTCSASQPWQRAGTIETEILCGSLEDVDPAEFDHWVTLCEGVCESFMFDEA